MDQGKADAPVELTSVKSPIILGLLLPQRADQKPAQPEASDTYSCGGGLVGTVKPVHETREQLLKRRQTPQEVAVQPILNVSNKVAAQV